MTYQQEYERWLKSEALSESERVELESIRDNPDEIKDRFFAPLEFGTAGLRGTLGPGLRRMNVHVVRWTTQAFAALILGEGKEAAKRGVAIAYDCRHFSAEFARETAAVLAANGIHVKLFDSLRPTPELSFAIREYECIAGVNITASHNPKEYNGYKVYWSDGAQLPPEHAAKIAEEMLKTDIFRGVLCLPFEDAMATGRIEMLGEETDKKFLDLVLCQSIQQKSVKAVGKTFKLVYTPFHGTGYKLIPHALRTLGFEHVLCVPEQMVIDGSFPTVASPNPENPEGFELAVELARQNDVDLIIGSDPDADRVGVMVRDKSGSYVVLSGNQTGVLLLDYIIKARNQTGTMPHAPIAIKTIVTGNMAKAVAERNGVKMYETFTGFKFMAELLGKIGHKEHYLLAFEESFGYMVGDHARDKDAVTAAMLVAEMASWYSLKNMTLYDALEELYKTYGYYKEHTLNIVMTGLDGLEKMKGIMEKWRNEPPQSIDGVETIAMRDYRVGERYVLKSGKIERLDIKGSNVLYYEMADGTVFIMRPSGTEPKMKVYIMARGDSAAECDATLEKYTAYAEKSLR